MGKFSSLDDAVTQLAALTGREPVAAAGRWRVYCWLCADKISASPAVAVDPNRRGDGVLVAPMCGCDRERLLAAAGLDPAKGDLFFAPGSPPADPRPERKAVARTLLDEYYDTLLGKLRLLDRHKQALLAAGWESGWVEGYRSWEWFPACQAIAALLKRHPLAEVAALPGVEEVADPLGGGTKLRARRMPDALVVPCRGLDGRVQALRLRTDSADAKYLYLSGGSTRFDNSVRACPHLPPCPGDRTVVRLTEGEKKADYATRKTGVWTWSFPGVDHWPLCLAPLREAGAREVRLAFDADFRSNPAVARQLHLAARRLAEEGFAVAVEVWDAAYKGIDDLLAAGGTPEAVLGDPVAWTLAAATAAGVTPEEIEAARNARIDLSPPPAQTDAPRPAAPPAAQGGGKKSDATLAYDLMVGSGMVGLLHNGADYVSWPEGDGWETVPAGGELFVRRFSSLFLERTGQVVRPDAVRAAVTTLVGRHLGAGEAVETRHAFRGDRLYIDLCDPQRRVVEVDAAGWRLAKACPVRFVRGPEAGTLPVPAAGDSLEDLRPFFNVSDDDFLLVLGWVVQAYLPDGGFFHLGLRGVAGSAKSTTTRLCKQLTDPIAALELPGFPPTDRDLMIAAFNSKVLVFDNLTKITPEVSDVLCRLATGGELRVRKLYSDAEEVRLRARRPVVLNGIPDIVQAGDLAERMLSVELHPIPPSARRGDAEFWRRFAAAWPGALGLVLDAVSGALRCRDEVRLDRPPRMLDAAKWAAAGLEAVGVPAGAWEAAYWRMRDEAQLDVAEGNPVTAAVLKLMRDRREWDGCPAEFYEAVTAMARVDRTWPANASWLMRNLRVYVPELEAAGVTLEAYRRGGGAKRVRVRKIN